MIGGNDEVILVDGNDSYKCKPQNISSINKDEYNFFKGIFDENKNSWKKDQKIETVGNNENIYVCNEKITLKESEEKKDFTDEHKKNKLEEQNNYYYFSDDKPVFDKIKSTLDEKFNNNLKYLVVVSSGLAVTDAFRGREQEIKSKIGNDFEIIFLRNNQDKNLSKSDFIKGFFPNILSKEGDIKDLNINYKTIGNQKVNYVQISQDKEGYMKYNVEKIYKYENL